MKKLINLNIIVFFIGLIAGVLIYYILDFIEKLLN